MSFDWPRFTIQELIDSNVITIQKDGNHGSNYPRASEFGDVGVAFLTAKLLDDAGNIDFAAAPRLSEEKASKFKFGFIEENDVLLSHNATVGRVAVVPNYGEKVLIGTSLTHYRLDTQKLLPQYLAAYFASKDFQNQLAAVMSQTTRNQVPITAQRKLEVVVPSIEVQEKLTNISGSIIQKVSTNTLMNQTLEQMAQAIFKSWFVDFDPVKAKMNGEQPEGMDEATASLFPEKLVESELGLIPEGWEPKQLKDILELAYGKALKKTDRVEGDVPVYGSGGLTGYHNQSLVEGPGIIVGRKGTVGSVYWEPKSFYPIDTVFYVKPKAGYSLNYCYLILQNLGLKNMNTDAAVPGLNRNNAYRLEVVTPSQDVLNKFESLMHSFQSKVDGNNAENSSLETLRDTLLPKLLSGEIELGQAQELAEVE
ncbi:restriction endonuclease subunit S [Vibrio alginolyticus]|nr:restriction endonuclease subunit S [Vibrio alginolyticus]